VEAAPAVIETGEETLDPPTGQGKKRKRTGKEREERKQAFLAVSRLGYDERLQADMKAQKEKAEAGDEVEDTQEGEETGVAKPEADVGAEPEVAAAPEVDLDRLSKRLVSQASCRFSSRSEFSANCSQTLEPSLQACKDNRNATIDQKDQSPEVEREGWRGRISGYGGSKTTAGCMSSCTSLQQVRS
jgi:hypothetical protein